MSTFFQDAFNGTNGTALEAHTPDVGTSWAKHGSGTSPALNGSGELVASGSAEFIVFRATDAPPSADYFVQVDDLNAFGRMRPMVRVSADGQNGYFLTWGSSPSPGQYQLLKRVAGDDSPFIGQTALAGTTSMRLVCRNNGSGGVDLDIYAGTAGGSLALLTTLTDPGGGVNFGGAAPFTSAGFAGLYVFGAGSHHADNFIAATGTSPGITAGTISVTTSPPSDPTHVRLTAAASSGGTGALTYQWYRSTTPGFTPGAGNILSGQTSLTLVDTPPSGAIYYYKVRTTDAASATVDSATFGASYWDTPLALGFAGDSNYVGVPSDGTESVPTAIRRYMTRLAGPRGVTISNQAVAGTKSTDWVPGQSTYDTAATAFATFLGAAPSGALKDLFFMVGTNDAGSVDQTTYQARLTTACSAFLAAGWGRVLLCYQLPIHSPADETRNQQLLLFQASLATVAAGDPTHIKVIGQDVYKYMFTQPAQMNASDGIHLLAAGVESMAAIQTRDYTAILNPSAAGVAGGSFAWAA